MLKKWDMFDYINTVIMLAIAVIMLYPMLYVASVSFSSPAHIVQHDISFFPRDFNLESYKIILSNDRIPRAYLNTIVYVSLGTFVSLFLTAISAYPLAKKGLFGKKFFMLAIIITMFFNGGMIPNYIIVQKLGMIDTLWALIIPNAIWSFNLLIMKSFFESISPSLHESATIDGASEYRILFQIIIPLSKAALTSIGLFYFMGSWNSYFIPMIYLNDIKKYPLQVVLREMLILSQMQDMTKVTATKLPSEGLKSATIFIAMIPVLMIYPFVQKYFTKGVMIGSVKE